MATNRILAMHMPGILPPCLGWLWDLETRNSVNSFHSLLEGLSLNTKTLGLPLKMSLRSVSWKKKKKIFSTTSNETTRYPHTKEWSQIPTPYHSNYSAWKRYKLWKHTTWMNIKKIRMSEKKRANIKRLATIWFHYMVILKWQRVKMNNRLVVARDSERGKERGDWL